MRPFFYGLIGIGHTMDNVEITPAAIRFSAMNLLAMREHSVFELEKKLLQKFNNTELLKNSELLKNTEITDGRELFNCQQSITIEIAKLTNEGLQSDARFTEAFIAMRQRQGKGPLVILMELKERGIHNEVVLAFMNTSDPIWNQTAKKVFIKKFGDQASHDRKLLSKQMRFLTTRGFSSANIQYAIKNTDLCTD